MRRILPSLVGTAVILSIIGFVLQPIVGFAQQPAAAKEPASTPALLAEVRKSFTLGGERIPPEIFRDFGDGNLADPPRSVWVTVDLRAAIGSNLYSDEITKYGDWIIQRKPAPGTMNGAGNAAGFAWAGNPGNRGVAGHRPTHGRTAREARRKTGPHGALDRRPREGGRVVPRERNRNLGLPGRPDQPRGSRTDCVCDRRAVRGPRRAR